MTEENTNTQKNKDTTEMTPEEIDDWFNQRLDALKESRAVLKNQAHRTKNDNHAYATLSSTCQRAVTVDSYLIEIYQMLKEIIKEVDTHTKEFQSRKPSWDYMQHAMEQTKETLKQGK